MIDSYTLLALVAAVAVVAAVLLWPSARPPVVAPRRSPGRAGRALIDQYEEIGRDAAGVYLESRLGQRKADSIFREMGEALSPAPSAAPPSSPN